MKKIALLLIVSLSMYAYNIGDKVDSDILNKLQLDESKEVYIIDFFASWCQSCKREIKELSTLHIDGAEVVGVDVDENLQDGLNFQKSLKVKNLLTYRVYSDSKGKIVSKFDPVGVPAIYIVKNGKIVSAIIGAKDNIKEIIKSKIQGLK